MGLGPSKDLELERGRELEGDGDLAGAGDTGLAGVTVGVLAGDTDLAGVTVGVLVGDTDLSYVLSGLLKLGVPPPYINLDKLGECLEESAGSAVSSSTRETMGGRIGDCFDSP